MFEYDLIISDNELKWAGRNFKAFAHVLESVFDQYKLILDNAVMKAVPSGEVHDALVLYADYIIKVQTISDKIGEKFDKLIDDYIHKIEDADDYLYDAGILNVTRDFSKNEYKHLIKCLDDPWCWLTDNIGDWIYEKVITVFGLLKWDDVKVNLQICHKSLLDFNDVTADGLHGLFEAVYAVDKDYGNKAEIAAESDDNAKYYFTHIVQTMHKLQDILDEMAYIINPHNGSFNVGAIEARLGSAYKELLQNFEKAIAIPEYGSIPTIDEISDFASQPWAALYFDSFERASSMFIDDIGGLQALQMIIFKMFDITKVFVTEGYYMGDAEDFYTDYLTKKQMLSVLEDMSSKYKYSESYEQETIDDCKTFLEFVKKCGSNVYDYLNKSRLENGKLMLDGRTIEARKYREFLDSLGGAEKILEYGDDAIEFLSRLFVDYSKGIGILESFENNYCDDAKILKCINEIKSLFNKEFERWAMEGIKKIAQIGLDAVLKEMKSVMGKVTPVTMIIDGIDKGIGAIGDITGLGSEAESMMESMVYFKMYSSSKTAFYNALTKVQNADPNSNEYAALVEDLNNCFELHKKNMIEMFKAMAGASHGSKEAYYKYCAKQAENLSMRDAACPDILSYDEFLALEP